MSTITAEQQNAILDFVMGHKLPRGLGTKEEACSIAAINLALTGELTDAIPDCMSLVIGRWIIRVQDSMPDEMRNSPRWKELLPLAAGTGRDVGLEDKRMRLISEWMWTQVLPRVQPIADRYGFGTQWRVMCTEKTAAAAEAAARAAEAAEAAWAA